VRFPLWVEIAGKVVSVWSEFMCSLHGSMTSGWGMAGQRVNVHVWSSLANGFGFGSGH
jgi:hypothetical protein